MNLTLVVMWLRVGGGVVHTTYGDIPGLCLTLTCITGKDFTNVSTIMACFQVIFDHLDIIRVI